MYKRIIIILFIIFFVSIFIQKFELFELFELFQKKFPQKLFQENNNLIINNPDNMTPFAILKGEFLNFPIRG